MTVKITSFLSSMPSYSSNMMTSRRDSPLNRSTRPLLMERKPQLLPKRKTTNNDVSHDGGGNIKTRHGFNDFDDIVNQQFNKNVNTHNGYPYGSPPPSPTVNSNDFVFSDNCHNIKNNRNNDTNNTYYFRQQHENIQQQQKLQQQFESIPKPYPPSACDEDNFFSNENQINYEKPPISNRITEFNNWSSNSRQQKQPQQQQQRQQYNQLNQTNNFESNNYQYQHQQLTNQQSNVKHFNTNINNYENTADINNDYYNTNSSSGPFIFGVHDPSNMNIKEPSSSNNNHQSNNIRDNATVIDSNKSKLSKNSNNKNYPNVTKQTNSDTSSSSKEDNTESKLLFKCRKKSPSTDFSDKKIKHHKGKYQPNIKCVLVGDGAVGKTNLIVSYLENRFITEHIPTASDIYNAEVMVNGNPVDVCLCDTAGQDTLDPLRELCYPDCDVFLLCFSVIKPETFDSIKTKWAPKFIKSKAALILVGTQADLKNDKSVLNKLQTQGEKIISFTDACDFAISIGAKYIETSSLTQDKIKDMFDAAIWEALLPKYLPPKPPLWKRLLCLA